MATAVLHLTGVGECPPGPRGSAGAAPVTRGPCGLVWYLLPSKLSRCLDSLACSLNGTQAVRTARVQVPHPPVSGSYGFSYSL